MARRAAAEAGVDLNTVTGTGPRGRIEADDVANAGTAAAGSEERVKLVGPPAALARYMDDSRSIPTATTFRTIPVGILDTRRAQLNGALKAIDGGKLSFTHLVACCLLYTSPSPRD